MDKPHPKFKINDIIVENNDDDDNTKWIIKFIKNNQYLIMNHEPIVNNNELDETSIYIMPVDDKYYYTFYKNFTEIDENFKKIDSNNEKLKFNNDKHGSLLGGRKHKKTRRKSRRKRRKSHRR